MITFFNSTNYWKIIFSKKPNNEVKKEKEIETGIS